MGAQVPIPAGTPSRGPLSYPAATVRRMVKFDPEGFMAMMGRIAAEGEAAATAVGYEDLEPDYEYMMAPVRCACACH